MEQVKEEASTAQAMQVLRDLCLVARVEGHVSEPGCAVLDEISLGLRISPKFVCQTLDCDLDPD